MRLQPTAHGDANQHYITNEHGYMGDRTAQQNHKTIHNKDHDHLGSLLARRRTVDGSSQSRPLAHLQPNQHSTVSIKVYLQDLFNINKSRIMHMIVAIK